MKHLNSKQRTRWVAQSGILAGIAIVLMYLEFPLPLMPGFLKFDFSEIPILIAAFTLGPWSAILIELVKNAAHLPVTGTGGVGELANFLVGCAFVVPAGIIYRRNKSKKSALIAMLTGTLVMTLFASLMNYFVMIPFYVRVMGFPLEAIISMVSVAREPLNQLFQIIMRFSVLRWLEPIADMIAVSDLKTLIVFVFVPFNLFKGIVVSLIVAVIYKRISCLMHKNDCDLPAKQPKE